MTDLASLVLEIDSTQVPKGTAALDGLTAAGKRADDAVTKLGRDSRTAGQAASDMAQKAQLSASGINRMGQQGRLTSFHMQNLGFQANDLFVSLASGQNPMRVFIQQGSQIAQIGAQAGVGLGGMAKAVLGIIAPFSGLAAAAGIAGIALLGIKQATESDAGLQRYVQTLGLTKKEMEDLKDVTVTWGDVVGATFDVLAERAGTSSSEIKGAFGTAFTEVGNFGKFSAQVVLAAFAAAVKGVYSLFSNLPGIVGNAAVAAANVALTALEGLVNKGIGAINTLTASVNAALGTGIPQIADVSLGRVEAKFSGSFAAIGKDMKGQFFGTFEDVGKGMERIVDRANQRARSRLKQQADDIIGDRTPKKEKGGGAHKAKKEALSEEEKAYRSAMKAAQDYVTNLERETDSIGKSALETKRMEVATAAATARKAAAVAPTSAQADALNREADAILRTGAAWERVYKDDQIRQFQKNNIEQIEFENSLFGKSAELQRIMRAEREATNAGIDRGSDAWNRYVGAVQQAIANDNVAAQQAKMLQWADQFSDSLTDVIMGTKSLGAAFKDIARSIIADIIKMTIKMLIFKAISGIFGGAVGGGGGAAASAASGVVGPRAAGGPVARGSTFLVGERGPELFRPSTNGTIVPNGKMAANNNAPVEITIGFGPAPEFAPYVQQVSQAHATTAARIAIAHTNKTISNVARPKLNGKRG